MKMGNKKALGTKLSIQQSSCFICDLQKTLVKKNQILQMSQRRDHFLIKSRECRIETCQKYDNLQKCIRKIKCRKENHKKIRLISRGK
jgi:hypothetical protein